MCLCVCGHTQKKKKSENKRINSLITCGPITCLPLSTQSYFAAVEIYQKELAEFEAALDNEQLGKKTVLDNEQLGKKIAESPVDHEELPPPYPGGDVGGAAAAAAPLPEVML